MNLWKNLLISGLQNQDISIDLDNEQIIKQIIDQECYRILSAIKLILDDQTLTDNDCFEIIDKIVLEFTKLDIHTSRHDF